MSENKEPKFVSAVVYVHNNESVVEQKLSLIDSELSAHFERYEIICVNDASTDSSVDSIKQFSKKISAGALTVINLSFYHGLESAMTAGVDLAIGDFVYEFDTLGADFPKETITDIYSHCLTGYDIVSAGPEKNPRFASKIYYKIFNSALNAPHALEHDVVRIVTRRALNRVHGMSQTIPYRKALYATCGLKTAVLHYRTTEKSEDKRTTGEKTGFAFHSLVLFTSLAYKIAFALSVIMMIFAVGVGIYACVTFFGGGNPIDGWTSTMLFLSAGFFGIFVLLGIILKYLSVVVDLVFNKQKYFVESVEKVNNRR